MELWDAQLDGFPSQPQVKDIIRCVQTAGQVLKTDLADFEIEWLSETLLFQPVNLSNVITTNNADSAWSKTVADAFKLITNIIDNYGYAVEKHQDEILRLCELPYDPQTRKHALDTIKAISKSKSIDYRKYLSSLQEGTTCKAPLAELIGTICQHHPDKVADDINEIWRSYLSLLEVTKNTDTVIEACLQGILGLFTHFINDLPIMELKDLYAKISKTFIYKSKCQKVCLKIISKYSLTLKDMISYDKQLRMYLWEIGDSETLISVYTSLCTALDREKLQTITQEEITPQSNLYTHKYTAIRILSHIRSSGLPVVLPNRGILLEAEVRRGLVTFDDVEAISCHLDTWQPHSCQLLQTCILFSYNIPNKKNTGLIANAILGSPDDDKNLATIFLIKETCNPTAIDNNSIDKYIDIWTHMFTIKTGDEKTIDMSKKVFENYMNYFISTFESYFEENCDGKILPQKLDSLLILTSIMLPLQTEDLTHLFEVGLNLVLKLDHNTTSVINCLTEFYKVLPDVERIQYWQQIQRCKDESLLCALSMAIVELANNERMDTDNLLIALKIIFTRRDVEVEQLIKALEKFQIILKEKITLDPILKSQVMSSIYKLKNCSDSTSKDERILKRNILMFLGKYGNIREIYDNNNNNKDDQLAIVKLKDLLQLNIFNNIEGKTYKINLKKLLAIAIETEDSKTLEILLTILCSMISSRPDDNLRLALTQTIHSLSRSHSHSGDAKIDVIHQAIQYIVPCIQHTVKYISEEISPGVRKLLSNAIEDIILRDPCSQQSDVIVDNLYENAGVLMKCRNSTSKRAGLDLSETLLIGLKDNSKKTEIMLPYILILIMKTLESDSDISFNIATQMFIEKIDLFLQSTVNDTINEIIRFLVTKKYLNIDFTRDTEVSIYRKTVRMSLKFLKEVIERNRAELKNILNEIFDATKRDFQRNIDLTIFVLSESKCVFDLDKNICVEILSRDDFVLLNAVFEKDFSGNIGFEIEAVLLFLEKYSEYLLEFQYNKTLEILSKIIKKLSPKSVIKYERNISSCMSVYKQAWKLKTPKLILDAIETWTETIDINYITKYIEKHIFDKHEHEIYSLNKYLEMFDVKNTRIFLSKFKIDIEKWPKILLNSFSNGEMDYLKNKTAALSAILSLSLKFLSREQIKRIILEGSELKDVSNELVGVKFCRVFMQVFFDCLTAEPFLIVELNVGYKLLSSLVECFVKKNCPGVYLDTINTLVDEIWPHYSTNTDFNDKQRLLNELSSSPKPLPRESNPMRWVIETLTTEHTSLTDKSKLVGLLANMEVDCSQLVSLDMPCLLSELTDVTSMSFYYNIQLLSMTKDLKVLDVIITLASNDSTEGWYDELIQSCMTTLAACNEDSITRHAYRRNWEGLQLTCRRVLLPLLRYSTTSFCEQFFSTILEELLSNLKKCQPPSLKYSFKIKLVNYVRACNILQLLFEKLPRSSLESPSSTLYSHISKTTQSWYIIREVCKLCVTIREKISLPSDADEELKKIYRQLHISIYSCLSAAICYREPSEPFYDVITSQRAWGCIADENEVYDIKIRTFGSYRTLRRPVSCQLSPDLSLLTAGTTRTAAFLSPLAENTAKIDLMMDSVNEVETHDIHIPDDPLNRHPSAATLTSVICHLSKTQHVQWRGRVAECLSDEAGERNCQWLLARALCNAKDDIRHLAGYFAPALLALVSNTPIQKQGENVLNGLHIEILESILDWHYIPDEVQMLDKTLRHLITTCILYSTIHLSVYRTVIEVLTRVLDRFDKVSVKWDVFEGFIKENNPERVKSCYQILQKVTKKGIHVPSLLDSLLSKMTDDSLKHYGASKMAELLGLALSTCHSDSDRCRSLTAFRSILEKTRGNRSEYVKMVFYSQNGFADCCGESDFRYIIDLTPKILGPEKTKCLQIISTHLKNSKQMSKNIELAIETVDLSELILSDSIEAMGIIKNGLTFMEGGLKRRLVMSVACYCQHSNVKVRAAALDVILTAVKELYPKPSEQSSAKKAKMEVDTPIMGVVESQDIYLKTLIYCLGLGVTDFDADIQKYTRIQVAKLLYKNDLKVRLYEAFIIVIYVQTTFSPVDLSNNKMDLSVSVSAVLDMAFDELRNDDRFKMLKLKDDPLVVSRAASILPSKLLTMSKTYRGTFRTLTRSRKITQNTRKARSVTGKWIKFNLQDLITDIGTVPDVNQNAIDVQVTVDSILTTLLDFSKQSQEASITIFIDIFTSIQSETSDFDLTVKFYDLLRVIVKKSTCNLTPLVIRLLREVSKNDRLTFDSMNEDINKLLKTTKGTEGEQLTVLLHEEIKLKTQGYQQFHLGTLDTALQDIFMKEDDFVLGFPLDDLEKSFGCLSNWEDLTIKQKEYIVNDLPSPVWVEDHIFKTAISKNYNGSNETWFDAMVKAYKHADVYNAVKWTKDFDRWPRRQFDISAMTESTQWHCKSNTNDFEIQCEIQNKDCLLEWAVRLMIRKSFMSALPRRDGVDIHRLSRSHELLWCERANEMGLAKLVSQCVQINIRDLYESETLSWLEQKIISTRIIAINENDQNSLLNALQKAETYLPQYIDNTTAEVVNGMYKLILQLNMDLNSLTTEKISHVLEEVYKRNNESDKLYSEKNKRNLSQIYEICLNYYEDVWRESDEDIHTQNALLSSMTDVTRRAVSCELSNCQMMTDLTFNKLSEYRGETLGGEAAEGMMEILKSTKPDSFISEQVKNYRHLFPTNVLKDQTMVQILKDGERDVKMKKCLQLVCDPNHALAQYCEKLILAYDKGESEWKAIFDNMKTKIFENNYSGPDYRLLYKYKNDLYNIYDYENSTQFKKKSRQLLQRIITQSDNPRATLRLSSICPALTDLSGFRCERDGDIESLLGLTDVKVVKFDEKVQVTLKSIRRPCVIRALLSDGTSKKYLLKTGEDLRTDRAARRACLALGVEGYMVTPISPDCGIIEYLDDCHTVRSLVGTDVQLQSMFELAPKTMESELILTSAQASISKHKQLCGNFPSTALRSALELNSVSIQDFINKRMKFIDTLTSMTISNWILGLGDRHLENILLSIQDGKVLNVDWSDVFLYGYNELPLARLTRNFLAVVNSTVLEAKLQNSLIQIRNSHKLYEANIKMSFRWMGGTFDNKFKYIQSILDGTSLPHHITIDIIEASDKKYKENHIQLLQDIFKDLQQKDVYSVEDQITSLLRQCTDPRILSVTRQPWEPWI